MYPPVLLICSFLVSICLISLYFLFGPIAIFSGPGILPECLIRAVARLPIMGGSELRRIAFVLGLDGFVFVEGDGILEVDIMI